MRDLEENKSQRGVTCHRCHKWIRPGLIYYKYHYSDHNIPKYTNYCIICAEEELERGIKSAKEDLKQCRKWIPIYEKETIVICDTCKYKYRHLVGECNPTEYGCRPKLIRSKYKRC